jgi:hypothetical protein
VLLCVVTPVKWAASCAMGCSSWSSSLSAARLRLQQLEQLSQCSPPEAAAAETEVVVPLSAAPGQHYHCVQVCQSGQVSAADCII